jgi:hypothetical protein
MSKTIWARSTKGTRAVPRLDALLVVKQIRPAIHIRTLYEQATGHHWEVARQKKCVSAPRCPETGFVASFHHNIEAKDECALAKKNDDLVT